LLFTYLKKQPVDNSLTDNLTSLALALKKKQKKITRQTQTKQKTTANTQQKQRSLVPC
jgi:hypothetical protein